MLLTANEEELAEEGAETEQKRHDHYPTENDQARGGRTTRAAHPAREEAAWSMREEAEPAVKVKHGSVTAAMAQREEEEQREQHEAKRAKKSGPSTGSAISSEEVIGLSPGSALGVIELDAQKQFDCARNKYMEAQKDKIKAKKEASKHDNEFAEDSETDEMGPFIEEVKEEAKTGDLESEQSDIQSGVVLPEGTYGNKSG